MNKYDCKIMLANENSTKDWEQESIIKSHIVMGKKLPARENWDLNRRILRSLGEYPDFVGMIDVKTGEEITFADMKDRSVRCALWLRKQGISENDVIGISTPNHVNDYVPYLATLYSNAIANPWPHDASEENAQYFFEICRPKVMFACKDSIGKLVEMAKHKKTNCKFVVFEKHEEYLSLEEILTEQTQDQIDDFQCSVPSESKKKVSLIRFSSGTTGAPKAIMLSYRSLCTDQAEECGMQRGMTCLWYSTLAWITSGMLILSTIQLRCTRIIHREFEPEATAEVIEKYKISFVLLRPYLLMQGRQANIFDRYDFTQLKVIIFGGTKTNKAMLEECQKSLPHTFMLNAYASTEAGGVVTTQTKNCKHIESVGYVCSGVKLKIVDPNTGKVLGPNQEGEIYFKTDTMMLGYLNNPEETKKTMDREGWIQSGDIGHYDEDGEVFIGDRLKALIKTKSFFISPSEIEEVLMQHPTVKDCAVVSVEHAIDIERPFAFIVKVHSAQVTAKDLIEFCASKDERYRLIGGVVFVDQLPFTHTAKKCLRTLQDMAKTFMKN